MLYAIRASNPKSRALEEMAAIYRLDAANPQLEPLLLQEVRKVERQLLGLKFNSRRKENKRRYNIPTRDVGAYVIDLQDFARQITRLHWKILAQSLTKPPAGDDN